MANNKIRNLVFTGLCIALGLVLPSAFHFAGPTAGRVFLPMHIPVLLCGLITGWPYGLACGILTPLLSSILTGMPPAAVLPGMLFELAAYGLVTGLVFRFVHTKSSVLDTYIALIGGMLAGRVLAGVLNALVFSAGSYTMSAWVASSFVTALPGIAIQLVFIPAIVQAMRLAKLVQRKA